MRRRLGEGGHVELAAVKEPGGLGGTRTGTLKGSCAHRFRVWGIGLCGQGFAT